MYKQNRLTKPDCNQTNYENFKNCIKPTLLQMSENHCSYCDEHFYNSGNLLVEHFQNKNVFPELKFEWENLFVACGSCNSHKRDSLYSENPKSIKPDEPDYCFDKYFGFDSYNGKIIAKDNRAKLTIDFLNLNNEHNTEARLSFISELVNNEGRIPDKSFRFIIDLFNAHA